MQKFKAPLWDGEAPGHEDGFEIPTIEYFPAEKKAAKGCIIAFTGGAYQCRAPQEGIDYAAYFSKMGIDCFNVNYRVKPTRFPYPLLDARRAVRYVRANADKFGIDTDKIAVIGSSAGGHLAATLCTYKSELCGEGIDETDKYDYMPNAQILCYPVLEFEGHGLSFENLLGDKVDEHESVTPFCIADESTPKTFIWHAQTDACVKVNGTFRYASRLNELGVPVELHIYPTGNHGVGLAKEGKLYDPYLENWSDHLISWLKFNNWYN